MKKKKQVVEQTFDDCGEDFSGLKGDEDDAYAIFDDEDERFHGLESAHGGLVLTGTHAHEQFGTMWVSMGGLIYNDAYRERVVIEGFGFLGLDSVGDGEIDCYARGDFEAFKSGV